MSQHWPVVCREKLMKTVRTGLATCGNIPWMWGHSAPLASSQEIRGRKQSSEPRETYQEE